MSYQDFLIENKWTTILSYNLNNLKNPQAGGENPDPQLPINTQPAQKTNNMNAPKQQGNVIPSNPNNVTSQTNNKKKAPNQGTVISPNANKATCQITNKQTASQNSLKSFDKLDPQQKTLLKYEALLCQCSYLCRMSYVPADIFCRMTKHLELTPNAFNNYIRAIEKIYDNLFNYSCSYNSLWVINQQGYKKNFEDLNITTTAQNFGPNDIKGYFVQNKNKMNAYIYLYSNQNSKFNDKKTLYVAFKGSSSLSNFIEDLKSQFATDTPLSGLTNLSYCQGKAGRGFVKSLQPSVKELIEKVEYFKDKYDRIIITGHSLGGALATLFGMCLAKMPKKIGKPIHVVSFGAPTLFDPIGRNEFNALLNINENIFTLDRITDTGDVIPPVPVDLNHGGYNLLKTELKAFSKICRTNAIGELRSLFGIQNTLMQSGGGLMNKAKNLGIKNDLLIIPAFVQLFSNYNDFVNNNGQFNQATYRSKYRIKLGTNAKEQKGILTKAMPDANPQAIQNLFGQIEKIKNNNGQTTQNQAGGFSMGDLKSKAQTVSNKKGQRQTFSDETAKYKEATKNIMPNKVNYSCYKIMSMGFCHVVYMGVTYATVLRIPIAGMKIVKKKEPTANYTLYNYKNTNRLLSLNDAQTNTCKYSNQNNTNKNTRNTFVNKNNNSGNQPTKKPKSFLDKIGNAVKPQVQIQQQSALNTVANKQTTGQDPSTLNIAEAFFTGCSIL